MGAVAATALELDRQKEGRKRGWFHDIIDEKAQFHPLFVITESIHLAQTTSSNQSSVNFDNTYNLRERQLL